MLPDVQMCSVSYLYVRLTNGGNVIVAVGRKTFISKNGSFQENCLCHVMILLCMCSEVYASNLHLQNYPACILYCKLGNYLTYIYKIKNVKPCQQAAKIIAPIAIQHFMSSHQAVVTRTTNQRSSQVQSLIQILLSEIRLGLILLLRHRSVCQQWTQVYVVSALNRWCVTVTVGENSVFLGERGHENCELHSLLECGSFLFFLKTQRTCTVCQQVM